MITAVISVDPATEVGNWAQDGDHGVDATMYAFSLEPTANGPVPAATIKIQVEGDLHGRTLSGTYTSTATSPDGQVLDQDNGTFRGPRIDA